MSALGVFLILILLLSGTSESVAQKKSKRKKTFHSYKKWRYGSRAQKPQKLCKSIAKNRTKKRKSKAKPSFKKNKKYVPQAEVDPSNTVAKTTPTPKPAPVKTEPKPEEKPFEERSLEEKHAVEDKVLHDNNLPEPTSEVHDKIRKDVQEHLLNKKDDEPIKLEPLFFVLDQDEFSVVDMEPFLVAVEYALQGRMVLIEGHTDHRGSAEYNKKLSMKRVERIRQLMLDMGVPDDRISVIGYGEEMADTGHKEEDQHQDSRRVDFTVF